jgi:hypothetical protein
MLDQVTVNLQSGDAKIAKFDTNFLNEQKPP